MGNLMYLRLPSSSLCCAACHSSLSTIVGTEMVTIPHAGVTDFPSDHFPFGSGRRRTSLHRQLSFGDRMHVRPSLNNGRSGVCPGARILPRQNADRPARVSQVLAGRIVQRCHAERVHDGQADGRQLDVLLNMVMALIKAYYRLSLASWLN
jgi:hypothetical protein